MDITFSVENQIISRTDSNAVVSGSKNFLRAVFTLSPTWRTGHTITPVFRVGDKPYTPKMKNGRFLDDENSCIVPSEVLASAGVFFVSIFDETDNVRITANESPVRVIQSGYNTAEPSLTPTPTIYDEILRQLGDIYNKIVSPNWSQNDSEKPDYIKNRPFYKEQTAVDYVTLYASSMDADLQMGFYGKRIGLAVGQTYSVDIVSDTGETTTVDCECVDCAEDLNLPNDTIPLLGNNDFSIFDGVFLDDEGNPAVANNAVYTTNSHIVSVTIHGVSSIDEVIHKIPNEFLDVDDIFDANSQKPQSGKAVNNAMHSVLNQITVGTAQIEDSSVTADKLADKSVTTSKLADDAVTETNLANNSVFERAIQDGAVTRKKLAANSVTEGNIVSDSISNSKLKDGCVTGRKIKKPVIVNSVNVTEPVASISSTGLLSYTGVNIFCCIRSTSATEQILLVSTDLSYTEGSGVLAKIPLDFSDADEWNILIRLRQDFSPAGTTYGNRFGAEYTVYGYNKSGKFVSSYGINGRCCTDKLYSVYLRFGDVDSQQINTGSSIQFIGTMSND